MLHNTFKCFVSLLHLSRNQQILPMLRCAVHFSSCRALSLTLRCANCWRRQRAGLGRCVGLFINTESSNGDGQCGRSRLDQSSASVRDTPKCFRNGRIRVYDPGVFCSAVVSYPKSTWHSSLESLTTPFLSPISAHHPRQLTQCMPAMTLKPVEQVFPFLSVII